MGNWDINNSLNYGQNFNFGLRHYEIVQVNGRAGAENFRMAPNSNYLLLDNKDAIIWFVKTDGSGLLTATPYDYSPHEEPTPVDLNSIQQRLSELEEKINGSINTGPNKRKNSTPSPKQQPEGTN